MKLVTFWKGIEIDSTLWGSGPVCWPICCLMNLPRCIFWLGTNV